MLISELGRKDRPVGTIQFGGGVFLRGFYDVMVAKNNKVGISDENIFIVRSKTHEDPLAAQNYMYTHAARDQEHQDITLVDCISGSVNPEDDYEGFLRLADDPETVRIVSNTTESGIAWQDGESPDSARGYPARLAALIKRRMDNGLRGFLVLPCELIENNAGELRALVLRHGREWGFGQAFESYVRSECRFCSTLVDRIVSGKPSPEDEFGLPYEDHLINTSEYFHLWVIEGMPSDPRMPWLEDFNVKFERLDKYRKLKVRLLNGAHTSLIPYALSLGIGTVGDCLADERTRRHLDACLFGEILPSLRPEGFDEDENFEHECRAYAEDVVWRFSNPFIHHKCRSIALNSIDKYRVRVLPSVLDYERFTGKPPVHLLFALAKLIEMYKTDPPDDAKEYVDFMEKSGVGAILANREFWGTDLTRFRGYVERYVCAEEIPE